MLPAPLNVALSLAAAILAKLAEWGFNVWRSHRERMHALREHWRRHWHPQIEVPVGELPVPQDSPLYQHTVHPHVPRHAHATVRREQMDGSFSDRLAAKLTNATSTMACIYIFAGIGIGSLAGVVTGNVLLAAICGSLSSYFLQLVFLPILQKGSAVLNRHSEAQAEEMFHASQKTAHDAVEIMNHLSAQDAQQIALMQLNQQQMELLTRLVKSLEPTRLPKAGGRTPR